MPQAPSHALLSCGSNSGGQLGLGHADDVNRLSQVIVGKGAAAVAEGDRGEGSSASAPIKDHVFPPQGWTVERLASGANHTVAILERLGEEQHSDAKAKAREIWLCGDASRGQLGQALYDEASSRRSQTSFVRHDSAHGAEPVLLACGWDTTYFVRRSSATQDDGLISWGTTNDFGQLGVVDPAASSSQPKEVEHSVDYLEALEELTEALRGGRGPTTIHAIASSPRHVLFSLSFAVDGQVEAEGSQRGAKRVHCLLGFGASRHGQLGSQHSAAKILRRPKLIGAWTEGSDIGPQGQGREKSLKLAVGKEHSAILVPGAWHELHTAPPLSADLGRLGESSEASPSSSGDKVHLFGSNKSSQLDLASCLASSSPSPSLQVSQLECTWNGTFALCSQVDDSDKRGKLRLLASGKDDAGQLGPRPPPLERGLETDLSWLRSPLDAQPILLCGSEHVLLHLPSASPPSSEGAKVFGCGWNEHGNLATGDEVDSREPVQIWPASALAGDPAAGSTGLAEASVVRAWAGCGTTFVLVQLEGQGREA